MAIFEVETHSDVEMQKHTGVTDISTEFDGQRHWSWAKGKHYIAPAIGAAPDGRTTSQFYPHRDILSRKTYRPKDVLRYISPTDGKPTRALIQATDEALSVPSGDWRRRKLDGNAPKLLRISAWALQDIMGKEANTPSDWAITAGRVLITAPLLLLMVSFPISSPPPLTGRYKNFPGRCWEYPKYARNELLDAKPDAAREVTYRSQSYNFAGEYTRQLRPRLLIFLRDSGAFVAPDHSSENRSDVPYLFISYTREHFDPGNRKACGPLYEVAGRMTRRSVLA